MTPEDFPQFDDPRVREVMAAAANLIELIAMPIQVSMASFEEFRRVHDALKDALFAAQHTKPKEDRLWVHLVEAAWGPGKDFSWKRVADKARELLQDHGLMCTCVKCATPKETYTYDAAEQNRIIAEAFKRRP